MRVFPRLEGKRKSGAICNSYFLPSPKDSHSLKCSAAAPWRFSVNSTIAHKKEDGVIMPDSVFATDFANYDAFHKLSQSDSSILAIAIAW
jgi:hypothetical protein